MGCQKGIAKLIRMKDADYVLALKKNHKRFYKKEWRDLSTFIQVKSIRHVDKKIETSFRYYITSIPFTECQRSCSAIREHWHVENRLHWKLDVAFKEDQCRVYKNQWLFQCLFSIQDPRVKGRCTYPLINILVITLCALMTGANNWEATSQFGKLHRRWLSQFIGMSVGVPSPLTFARTLSLIEPSEFKKCLAQLSVVGCIKRFGNIGQLKIIYIGNWM